MNNPFELFASIISDNPKDVFSNLRIYEDLLNQLAQSNKNLYETLDPVPSEEIINNKIDENTS